MPQGEGAQDVQFAALTLRQAGDVPLEALRADGTSVCPVRVVVDHCIEPSGTFGGGSADGFGDVCGAQIDHAGRQRRDDLRNAADVRGGHSHRQVEAHHRFAHGVLQQDAVEHIGRIGLGLADELPPFVQHDGRFVRPGQAIVYLAGQERGQILRGYVLQGDDLAVRQRVEFVVRRMVARALVHQADALSAAGQRIRNASRRGALAGTGQTFDDV